MLTHQISLIAESGGLVALAQAGAQALSELPWGAHAIAGAGLVVGVALLLAGRKLMRTGMILAAAVLGGVFGFYAGPSVGLAVDPNILLAVGLALGAIAGVLLYRATVGVTVMLLLAAAGPLIAAGVMRLSAASDLAASTGESARAAVALSEEDAAAGPPESLDAAAEEAWKRVRAFAGSVRDRAGEEWGELERREKSILLGSSMLGAALGLFLGAMYPKRSAAVMSAFLGAGLALPSAAWLVEVYVPAAAGRLPKQAVVWLAVWAGLSVVGVAVQWTSGKKRADG